MHFPGSVLYHGLLDDNVYFGTALLDLFDVTRNDVQIDAAEKIAQVLLDEFEDPGEAADFLTDHRPPAMKVCSRQRETD